jgi:multidrug efflux pump subunit AcrB
MTMSHHSEAELLASRNTGRYFVETRQLSWVLLVGTVLWGWYAYVSMPERKDPEIPARVAAALVPWPGADAERIEQLVTRKVEEAVTQNQRVGKVTSTSRTSVAVVQIELVEGVSDAAKEFDDIDLKLRAIEEDLPDGAGPIQFIKDFGDTATLMLTVASPHISATEVALRARGIREAIEKQRASAPAGSSRFAVVAGFPLSVPPHVVEPALQLYAQFLQKEGLARDLRLMHGPGFIGVDGETDKDDATLDAESRRFVREQLVESNFHPDSWPPLIIRDPAQLEAQLQAVAGEKYSYRELDDITDLIQKTLQTLPIVSKVSRSGVLAERVYLDYSQERLASYGVQTSKLPDLLGARNISLPGGVIEVEGKSVTIDPSGEFRSAEEIGNVMIATPGGPPAYLRDLVTVTRGYESPARFLNFYTGQDADGHWHRNRAVTMSIQMRSGAQISDFAIAVDGALEDLRKRLPEDLIVARTSDQPLQVQESVDLFMKSLEEAIVLVVLVSLIGFWEWRSALLMALSIPLTLAMTFGMMHAFGIDLQQVSIASLIIALGLLVDDPVVAGDAIKRELAGGHPASIAAWLGPHKLATAILYATITNLVAYVPFVTLPGDTGKFMYSLAVVVGSSLVASRIVSMTFIPLLGYYLLRPQAETPVEERRGKGFAGFYYRIGSWAIQNRWKVLAGSGVVLLLGGVIGKQLKTQFFPKDLSYLSYVDVWLPEDAPLFATGEAARRAEGAIRDTLQKFSEEHADGGTPRPVLVSLTTFVGGGGPRFWASVVPELQQLNYAQIIIQVHDKHDTAHLIGPMQSALAAAVPGARIDVRQLETGKPVGIPVSLRISGEDALTLRRLAAEAKAILRSTPLAARVRDDWGEQTLGLRVETDADRANLSGITNLDVAAASATGINGYPVTTLREGNKTIPVLARLRMEERAQLADVQNLYVYSSQGDQKVPLRAISTLELRARTEKVQRRNQFRTVTVSAFPEEGYLASEVMSEVREQLSEFARTLPPGYRMEIGGEEEEQNSGFVDLAIVLGISVTLIFLALVFQFKHAIKPFIVFAAIPYGVVGALAGLWVMGAPFGFMAFLGIASLVGVIVSHIIVLFDFIEEKREEGEPLEQALLDAGIMRLRPVLITVGATVIALFPLAAHGGPLWEQMCYTQIGGLTAATFITLLLVPVIYSIFVRDLKLVKWEAPPAHHS